jgi:hypothetical protein
MAEGYQIATAYVTISPDTDDFAEQLQADVEEATSGVEGSVKISLDDDQFRADLQEDKAQLDELNGSEAKASLSLDDDGYRSDLSEDKDSLDEMDGRQAEARLGLDDDEYRADLSEDSDRLDEMDGKTATANLNLNDDQFNEKLSKDKQELNAANSETGEGSLLGAITMGIGSMLPGVGGAVAGLGLLGGTGALAFGGIAKALDAAHQSSQNVGLTSQQLAAQQASSSTQIQQSQESLSQAYEQSAQDAISSADSIEQAQMNLTSVQRNAANSQIQTLQSVEQAQQGVEQATYNLSEANYDLGQAYVQAKQEIVQLDDQLADSKLNVQAANLAVQQAEYNLLLTNQNAYSTDLDREQASLAVAQAKQQLKDATDQETDAQYSANLASQQGVNGSQTVIQAQQAVTAARYGMTDATQSYQDAVRNLTLTEKNNAQQITQAQMQVAEAQEQAAYQQKMDAQSVADAERNLTATITEQQLEMESMLSTSNSAANQFQKYMDALTPAGRAFVNQVLGMRTGFHELEDAAENSVVPGFTTWLKGISDLMPSITRAVGGMGSSISEVFAGYGRTLQSASGQQVFAGLLRNGQEFINTVLPPFGRFVDELGKIGSQNGAASGLADLLAGIGRGLTGLAASVGKNEKPINAFLQAVGNIIAQVGPALGNMIGLVAHALGPLTHYLDDHPNGTIVKILGDIVAGLLAFKGLQTILPDFISGPLAKLASKGGDALMSPFKDAAGKIPGLLNSAWSGVNQGWIRLSGRIDSGLTSMEGWAASSASKVKGALSSAWTGANQAYIRMTGKIESGLTSMEGWAASAASKAGSSLKSAWSGAQSGFAAVFGEGGYVQTGWSAASGWVSTFASNVGSKLSTATTAATEFATGFGSKMVSAGQSAITFVSGLGAQLATAARSTVKWLADNAVSAATYIGENVAEAASATAAFIAENAATLGLTAVIAALVAAIVYMATHWQQVTNDITTWTSEAYDDVIEPVFHQIAALAEWLYDTGIKPPFDDIADVAKALWHDVFQPVFSDISAGAHTFVHTFKGQWDELTSVFKTPVTFLINTVYNNGIRRLWNDVVGAVGLKSLDLPSIPGLAHGGIVPGTDHGRDEVLIAARPEEGVLVPGAVRAIGGRSAIDALNSAHGGGGRGDGRHYSIGGIVGDVGGFVSSAAHGVGSFLGGVVDAGKIVAALATGNTTALTSALGQFTKTDATAATLARVMTAIPRTLASDLVGVITGSMSGGGSGSLPSGGSNSMGSLPQNWHTIASYLFGHGFTKYAAAGVTGNVDAESAGDQEALEVGGGGGGGLIQWTPWQSYGPLITGDPSQDLMTQLAAIVMFGGGPAIVNRATSPSNAAMLYQDYYEKPASLTASLGQRMSSANAVYKAMGWGSYDSGGPLAPGATLAVNQTGQAEEVLTPAERAAWVAVVQRTLAQPNGGLGGGAPQVTVNFYGTQRPNPEEMAEIERRLALAVGGA